MSELLGPEREIVVGNNVFGLLRPAAGPVTLPGQGNFSFQMAGSEAYALTNGVASPAQVLGGQTSALTLISARSARHWLCSTAVAPSN